MGVSVHKLKACALPLPDQHITAGSVSHAQSTQTQNPGAVSTEIYLGLNCVGGSHHSVPHTAIRSSNQLFILNTHGIREAGSGATLSKQRQKKKNLLEIFLGHKHIKSLHYDCKRVNPGALLQGNK